MFVENINKTKMTPNYFAILKNIGIFAENGFTAQITLSR